MPTRYFTGLIALALGLALGQPVQATAGSPVRLIPAPPDASQSSVANSAPASRAIDGNPDGVFNNNSVTHTNSEANPWWQVDLKKSYRLDSVKLWNRTDCCSERLVNVSVFVSESPFTSADPAVLRTQTTVKEFAVNGPLAQTTVIATPAFGRYVRVQINGTGILSLAEVEVFASPSLTTVGNLALGKTVTASSSYEISGWGVARAVDGINTTTSSSQGWASNNSLFSSHTEWMQVDLGDTKAFDKVVLTPRTDGANAGYGFPVDFRIQVSNDNISWTTLTDRINYPRPDGSAQSFDVGTVAARYVRITGTALRANPNEFNFYRMQFAEVEVLATPAVTAGALYAPKPVGLLAEYFGNNNLSGAPLLKRVEAIDVDWSLGSPAGTIPVDNFSARWTGEFIAPTAGSYQFQTVSDDGIRVWIDGVLVINNWTTHAAATDTSAAYTFAAGQRIKIKVEYFESSSYATVRLRWKTPGATAFVAMPPSVLHAPEREGLQEANLARAATVTASSSWGSTGWGTARVVDGILTSSFSSYGWSSNNSTTINHTEWVQIDLGSPKDFNEIALTPRTDGSSAGYGFPVDFRIEISNDAVNWTAAVNRTAYPRPDSSKQSFDLGSVAARYVRVTGTNLRANPNDFSLFRMQFAEIEVFATPALMPTVGQSSTSNGAVETRAIDGDENGTFGANSVTHTLNQPNPWWQVDLKTIQKLDSIRLWNRTDCCTTRLSNVSVFVSNLPFTSNDPAALRNQAGVAEFAVSGALGQATTISAPVYGRYVRVQLNTNGAPGILSLAEVEIFGAASSGDGLQGDYFANSTLSGSSVYSTIEPVDFALGADAPNYATPADNFSARWMGEIEAPVSGSYQLQTASDNGVRVWIDGTLAIDNWTSHALTTDTSAALNWPAGKRAAIRVEFKEDAGDATLSLRWLTPGAAGFVPVPPGALYAPAATGLQAQYFANTTLGGNAVLKRIENVDFTWGVGSPAASVPADNFSARWTGDLRVPATGSYRLQTVSDDGVRVWIDGVLVIDNWTVHTRTTNNSSALTLTAGRNYVLKMEYFETAGPATARLLWLTPGALGYAPIPSANLYAALPIGPAGYTFCAVENETCSFAGLGRVAYGANGTFVERTVTDSTACSNGVFGDPLPGVVKACFYTTQLPVGPTGSTFCGKENESCAFSGTRTVFYGANGVFAQRVLTGGTACSNAVFGDPVPGVGKSCFTGAFVPVGPDGFTFCATEGGTCSFTGTLRVAYGANGVFVEKLLTDGTDCSDSVFGNPAAGTEKYCFTKSYTAPVNQSIFSTQTPITPVASDGVPYEMGMKFRAFEPGRITALRFWKAEGDSGVHTGHLWSADGTELATVTFAAETASGWQEQALAAPVSIVENTVYVVSVNTPDLFPMTSGGLATSVTNGSLSSVADGANGVFGPPGSFPAQSFNYSNYFRDVVFQTEPAGLPSKLSVSPAAASVSIGSSASFTVTVQDSNGRRIGDATAPVSLAIAAGSTGAGSISPAGPVVPVNGQAVFQFTPAAAGSVNLTATASYLTAGTAAVSIVDNGVNAFTTQVPALPNASDAGASYELGMKFRVSTGGTIKTIRYYRSPSDTGSHTGHIWSEAGEALATVDFVNETPSGWQEQTLPTPLGVQGNTVYVVSVNNNGFYAVTPAGLAAPVINGSVSTVADGANGVFGTTPGAFPTSSFNNSNYFRDIGFVAQPAGPPAKLALTASKLNTSVNSPVTYTVSIQDANGQNALTAANPITLTAAGVSGSFDLAMPLVPVAGQASVSFTPSAIGSGTISASAAGLTGASKNLSVTAAQSANPITIENQLGGTSAWRINNPVTPIAPEIAGYASATSVNVGESLPMKISLASPGQYLVNVYRLGYYGGLGGRLMSSSGPLSGSTQAACPETDPVSHLIECNWSVSYTLNVGANWTSGLYVANLSDTASGKQSQIWFVVRNDAGNSDILFQSSFSTFQAYNNYGSTSFRSLYGFNSTDGQPALKVSFDRPLGQVTIDPQRYDNMLKHERNMMMWLESQGYNVSYNTNLDTHTHPERLRTHRVFLSVGHDEYWSLEMRDAVEAARDSGVSLGFFSANTAYWRVRFEPSSSGDANRVMVCYKNPLLNDPVVPTYLWRGPENNRPENALMGVMYVGDDVSNIYGGAAHTASNVNDPYYANTGFADGGTAAGLVGFEWDAVVDNGFTPPGLTVLSTSAVTNPMTGVAPLLPEGTNAAVSNAVRYTAASGAKVFSTGSIQWMWGLNSDGVINPRTDIRIQQMTVNLLADMNARPLTPDSNIIVP